MSKIELINRGDLDVYLTGNPSITFFKSVFRKHTNFSMEDMIIGQIQTPKTSGKYSVKIPTATGDLLYKTNLILKGNKIFCGNGVANISTAVIDNIILSIGSREIDKTYGHYLEVYHELNQENPNHTITNMARIEDSSLYHIGHIADAAVLSAMHSNASYSYLDNSLCKPTNIMGYGLGYPPTQFQRLSKCGGVYCSPSYLQKYNEKEYSASYVASVNTRPPESVYMSTGDRDYLQLYDDSIGGFGNAWCRSTPLTTTAQIADSILKGDILGDCILPLNFWYCRAPGLAIPLIALNPGTDVELYIQFANSTDADWTDKNADVKNTTISYENDLHTKFHNDMQNKYLITNSDTGLKAIYDSSADNIFNFNIDISVVYIFLDNMERDRFRTSSHEYLIEQLQYFSHSSGNTGTKSTNINVDISSFHHPVKEIIWTGKPYKKSNIEYLDTTTTANADKTKKLNDGRFAHSSGIRFVWGKTGNNSDDNVLYGGGLNSGDDSVDGNIGFGATLTAETNTFTKRDGKFVHGLLGPSTPDCLNYCSYKIQLNNTDRCQWKPLQYFTRENIHKYHKGGCISVPDSIAVFSFALDPTKIEPTGTCNFSNIDSIRILRNQEEGYLKDLNVYAINYNILKFVGGQAGLTYVL